LGTSGANKRSSRFADKRKKDGKQKRGGPAKKAMGLPTPTSDKKEKKYPREYGPLPAGLTNGQKREKSSENDLINKSRSSQQSNPAKSGRRKKKGLKGKEGGREGQKTIGKKGVRKEMVLGICV